MSLLLVRQALEVALSKVQGGPCAWENEAFAPPDSQYRRAWLLPATPDNAEMGGSYWEQGIFQVNLYYPNNQGSAGVLAEAQTIAVAFRRATTFTRGGLSVIVESTPYIGPAMQDNNRYVVPVRISYRSFIRA